MRSMGMTAHYIPEPQRGDVVIPASDWSDRVVAVIIKKFPPLPAIVIAPDGEEEI